MMMISYGLDIALAALAAMMILKGHYGKTHQLAIAPALVAVLDASVANVLEFVATPVLSVLLAVLQLTVLAGCATVLYQDRVRARNKQERRRRRRDILRTQAAFEQVRYTGKRQSGYVCA